MEDRRSDLKFASSSRGGSGEASATAAAAGGKGKKGRTPSLVIGNDEREASAGTDMGSTWTGEKKAKIQDTPTSGDTGKVAMAMDGDGHSADKIVEEQEQGPDQIEGLDWDQDKLDEKIDFYLQQLKSIPDNEDFWVHCNDIQRQELNERLALYRIRAYKEEHRKITDANLKAMNLLDDDGYYELDEHGFDWYFDPQLCKYAHLQDYQRLMLRNNGEYENWEEYRMICSTLESDQAFVQLWEKLLSNNKLIEFFLPSRSCEMRKNESVVVYHALKIAGERSCIFKPLIYSGHSGLAEFMWTVRYDNIWDKYYAGFFGEIWKRVAKKKMNFKEALKEVYNEGKYTHCNFEWKYEFESSNPGHLEHLYNTHLSHIDEKVEEGAAYQLIMEAAKKIYPKRKTYYDYAKKKLGIAKEIGLIPHDPCESST